MEKQLSQQEIRQPFATILVELAVHVSFIELGHPQDIISSFAIIYTYIYIRTGHRLIMVLGYVVGAAGASGKASKATVTVSPI